MIHLGGLAQWQSVQLLTKWSTVRICQHLIKFSILSIGLTVVSIFTRGARKMLGQVICWQSEVDCYSTVQVFPICEFESHLARFILIYSITLISIQHIVQGIQYNGITRCLHHCDAGSIPAISKYIAKVAQLVMHWTEVLGSDRFESFLWQLSNNRKVSIQYSIIWVVFLVG